MHRLGMFKTGSRKTEVILERRVKGLGLEIMAITWEDRLFHHVVGWQDLGTSVEKGVT